MYVSALSGFGKVSPDCSVVNGHKAPVQEVSFSPFHPGLMATGSNDSTVRMILYIVSAVVIAVLYFFYALDVLQYFQSRDGPHVI